MRRERVLNVRAGTYSRSLRHMTLCSQKNPSLTMDKLMTFLHLKGYDTHNFPMNLVMGSKQGESDESMDMDGAASADAC